MISYGRQDIREEDLEAVRRVLESDWLTQGPKVPEFEAALANKVGARHACAVNSATSALHLACLALGLGPGDLLWTSPNTFVASANCARFCGADVDFIDIDPRTYNVCLDELERKLKEADRARSLPKILVVVHHSGQPCAMEGIASLAGRYGVRVIEDASHAIGAKYRDEYIGSCRYSNIAVFSFHPVKIITTGEGGAALTNSDELANSMALLRSHGVTRDEDLMDREPDGPWYYQQVDLGFNYRMTEIQAALGVSQLERLDEYVAARSRLAARYDELLSELPVAVPWQHPESASARHLYVIRLQLHRISRTHRRVFESLREQGIGVNLHYIPVPAQPYYRRLGFDVADYPQALQYYREAISLPLFPTMTEVQQNQVVTALGKALNG